jgi:putative ABC transport system substrate-binding protein
MRAFDPNRKRCVRRSARDDVDIFGGWRAISVPPATIGRAQWRRARCRFQPLSKYSFEPILCWPLSLGADMRRREIIGLLGGAAVAWPLAAQAQQPDRMRRIGVLMAFAENDPEGKVRAAVFERALQELGWTSGRNIRIDYRWVPPGDVEQTRAAAAELLKLAPDVTLAHATQATAELQRATPTVPVVFVVVSEPVAQGFVQSLAHPGGNITGFTNVEPTLGAKWLELLKEIAPRVTRVAVLYNPGTAPYATL